MVRPEGRLTAAQYEIMQLVWDAEGGMTVTEIWERISATRSVARTTILNLVDRLEKRRWLKRRKCEGVFRYVAAVDRRSAALPGTGRLPTRYGPARSRDPDPVDAVGPGKWADGAQAAIHAGAQGPAAPGGHPSAARGGATTRETRPAATGRAA